MSLRWKLFRFLSVESLLPPKSTESTDFEASKLFPSMGPSPSASQNDANELLSRFANAADRALHSHSYDALHAFVLPRAVVQLFNIPTLRLSSTTSPPSSHLPFPAQLSFSPHHTSVAAVHFVKVDGALPLLITLGMDDSRGSLKIWSITPQHPAPLSDSVPFNSSTATLDSKDSLLEPQKSQQKPPTQPHSQSNPPDDTLLKCIAIYRFQGYARPTALAVCSIQQPPHIDHIAVGFHDGVVVILSGDIQSEKATRVRVAPAPGEMIEARPIVFLEYVAGFLYTVSEMSVVAIFAIPSHDGSPLSFHRTVLDNLGVPNRDLCCVLSQSRELIVAKPEALYFFNRDGRGPCLAFPTEGKRALICTVANYVIHSTGQGSITAYDVVNKLIAHRGKGVISCVFGAHNVANRSLLLCMTDGAVSKLSEISLEERVNMLLKRGLYIPAVSLARAESMNDDHSSEKVLTKALRQYSEYLMGKDRYDEAAEQLIETIGGAVEPSWVIARLVEQSGLRSGLRLYLEALHAAGKAAFVHTKVLITCYRHDRARGAILGLKATEKTTDEYVINVFSDVDWSEEQVDAAIKLCRDSGLYKIAERVARRRSRYVQLVKTLIDDMGDVSKAFEVLRSLVDVDALSVIQACGRQLLVKEAEHFVNYLADAICRSGSTSLQDGLRPVLRADDFLPLFIDMPQWRAEFLERILARPGGVPTLDAGRVWILLFDSLACADLSDRLSKDGECAKAIAPLRTDLVERASPSENSKGEEDSMNDGSRMKPNGWNKRDTGRRALKVLQNRWSVIDLRAALDLAEQYGHQPCLEYLYEHLRMYKQLGVVLRMSGNREGLLRACRRHGEREPVLWMEAIRLFAPIAAREEYGGAADGGDDENDRREENEEDEDNQFDQRGTVSTIPNPADEVNEEGGNDGMAERTKREPKKNKAQDVLDEAIQAVERCGALSPLEIMEAVLGACPSGAWGIVRDYFERHCASVRREAVNAEHGGLLLEMELNELRKESTRLRDETVVIKAKNCASCEDGISLPAVHFFCGHSFHTGCLTAGDGVQGNDGGRSKIGEDGQALWGEECTKCAAEWDAMSSMRQAVQEKNERHDEFFATLKGARDGFATVIDFLERSPFI